MGSLSLFCFKEVAEMKKMWRLIGALIVLLSACSEVPAPTFTSVHPSSTPNLVATDTPVISTSTLTATLAPTPIAQAGGDERPFAVVIARMSPGPFRLLGGTKDGEWLSPEIVAPSISDDETYQIFGMGGPDGSAKGKQPVFEEFCRSYRVETDSYPLSGPAVGVTGGIDVTPRQAQEIPSETATYVDAVTDWLIKKGFSDPVVTISQILRVDIEGDGTDEVLISASHFVEPTGHDVEFGDYSLVLLRKVVGDSVETIPILADYYYQEYPLQFPLTYAFTFPADLDDDGVLEILVGVERWEGSGIIGFEFDGANAIPIFESLCGL
jgi:hypothetical protein